MPDGPDIKIRFSGLRTITELRKKLRDEAWVERKIMRPIGAVLTAAAQKAFSEQRFDAESWKPRYPNQSDPVVNIAGVVSDFLKGRKRPLERRFERRPAGIDTDTLRRSLTPGKAVTGRGYVVEVGSTLPHAPNVQFGGESSQPLTKSAKKLMAAWLKTERKSFKRKKAKLKKRTRGQGGRFTGGKIKPGAVKTAKARLDSISHKIGPLFRKDELVTNQVPRPYLGVTAEAESNIRELIGEVLENEGSGLTLWLEKKL